MEGKGHKEAIKWPFIKDSLHCPLKNVLHSILHRQTVVMWSQCTEGVLEMLMMKRQPWLKVLEHLSYKYIWGLISTEI